MMTATMPDDYSDDDFLMGEQVPMQTQSGMFCEKILYLNHRERASSKVNQCVVIGQRASCRVRQISSNLKAANLRTNDYGFSVLNNKEFCLMI